jgi:hypothetical protein
VAAAAAASIAATHLRGTPALRRKVCSGFTHARRWTTLYRKSLRKWLPCLDAFTAVVAARRMVALQPPPLRAGLERAPVRRAGDVIAQAAAAEAASAAGNSSGGNGHMRAAAAARQWTVADDAAVALGFLDAEDERAAFDLAVAALCASLAPRLAGFGAQGLAGLARRVGDLGVLHEGFWQVGGRAARLEACSAWGPTAGTPARAAGFGVVAKGAAAFKRCCFEPSISLRILG